MNDVEPLYYTIEPACGTKETGKFYPQVTSMARNYDFTLSNSIYQLSKKYLYKFPEIPINFDHFVMNGHSRLTDVLSNSLVSSSGLIVSLRLKKILEEFCLPESKFHPILISFKGEMLKDYFLFQIIPLYAENIDFPRSTFEVYDIGNKSLKGSKIDNLQDYYTQKDEYRLEWNNGGVYRSIRATKLYLAKEIKADIFKISGGFANQFFISRSLMRKLSKEALKGIETRTSILV